MKRNIPAIVAPAGLLGLLALALSAALPGCATHQQAESFEPVWEKLVVQVAQFEQDQPSGVAVSSTGRTFVCFPWAWKRPALSVAELMPDGSLKPFPRQSWNQWDGRGGPSALRGFVCAKAMYCDENDYLWVLDAGNPRNQGGVVTAGPKLFKIDLADDSIAQVFYFDHKRDLSARSFLSDFRVDSEKNVAYISDAGRGGIYVVDLKTREGHTALLEHASTKAEADVEPMIGQAPWQKVFFGEVPRMNVSGLALSPDGEWLYYHALTARTLYRVPTAILRDPDAPEAAVASLVEDLGSTGSVVDGMWMDPDENLYMTALEQDAILVRRPNGNIETFVADERMQWPDSLALGADGYLYFTMSMAHLHAPYRVRRAVEQPYYLMKASIDKVERAAAAWREAQQAEADAAKVAADARAAREAALRQKRQAEREQLAAQRRIAEAQRAERLAEAAAQRKLDAAGSVADAAEKQEQVAAQARAAAEQAKALADQARAAAEAAREAALEARRRADAAAAKADETRQAKAQYELTRAELEAARQERDRLAAAAAKAAEEAGRAQKLAASRLSDADAAQHEAEQALQDADAEASRAEEMAIAAEQAKESAKSAAAAARMAEYAEIIGEPENVETAEVPTD